MADNKIKQSLIPHQWRNKYGQSAGANIASALSISGGSIGGGSSNNSGGIGTSLILTPHKIFGQEGNYSVSDIGGDIDVSILYAEDASIKGGLDASTLRAIEACVEYGMSCGFMEVKSDTSIGGNLKVEGTVKTDRIENKTKPSEWITVDASLNITGVTQTPKVYTDSLQSKSANSYITFYSDAQTQNLQPRQTNTYNLGTTDRRYKNLYSNDIDNLGKIQTKDLTVTGEAHFFKLLIDEVQNVGGRVIITPANLVVDHVEDKTTSYRLYSRNDNSSKRTDNQFVVGDYIICQTFNIKSGVYENVSNKFYRSYVSGVGSSTFKNENNVDVSAYYIDILKNPSAYCESGYSYGTINPSVGDNIVLLGSSNKDRQSAIIISAYNDGYLDNEVKAPSFACYQGIDKIGYIKSKRKSYFDKDGAKFVGDFSITPDDIKKIASEVNVATPEIGPNGNWWVGGTDTSIKAQGTDGQTPYIKDDYWWIGDTSTGVKAVGTDGQTPTLSIGENGNWFIDGVDSKRTSVGDDGHSPYINTSTGTWWEWDASQKKYTDTNIKAKGSDAHSPQVSANGTWLFWDDSQGKYVDSSKSVKGDDGHSPYIGTDNYWYEWDTKENKYVQTKVKALGTDGNTPYINDDGFWWIGSTNTKIKAQGTDGQTPTIEIKGGIWYINGQPTNIHAEGHSPYIDTTTGTWFVWENGKWKDTGVKAQGTDGQNGKSYEGTEEYYYASASSNADKLPLHTVTQHSSWKSNISDTGFGENAPYLWNFEITKIKESNGTITSTATTPEIISYYAKDGEDGQMFDHMREFYYASTSTDIPTVSLTTTSSTAKEAGFSKEKPYLWNKEQFCDANDNMISETSWQLIAHWGQDGSTGADGQNGIFKQQLYLVANTKPAKPIFANLDNIGSWKTSPMNSVSLNTSQTRYINSVSAPEKGSGWRKFVGESGTMKYDKIYFNATTDNCVVSFDFIASTEPEYDFAYVGEIDKEYTYNDYDNLKEQFTISGDDNQKWSVLVPKQGTHFVYVMFMKDDSDAEGEDTIYYKWSETHNIWTTTNDATWNSTQKKWTFNTATWTLPQLWNKEGERGADGADGKPADFYNLTSGNSFAVMSLATKKTDMTISYALKPNLYHIVGNTLTIVGNTNLYNVNAWFETASGLQTDDLTTSTIGTTYTFRHSDLGDAVKDISDIVKMVITVQHPSTNSPTLTCSVPVTFENGAFFDVNQSLNQISAKVTDIEGNMSGILVSSEEITTAVTNIDNIRQGLLATGINIENKKVTVTADNFKIVTNEGKNVLSTDRSGDTTFDGLINARRINQRVTTVGTLHAIGTLTKKNGNYYKVRYFEVNYVGKDKKSKSKGGDDYYVYNGVKVKGLYDQDRKTTLANDGFLGYFGGDYVDNMSYWAFYHTSVADAFAPNTLSTRGTSMVGNTNIKFLQQCTNTVGTLYTSSDMKTSDVTGPTLGVDDFIIYDNTVSSSIPLNYRGEVVITFDTLRRPESNTTVSSTNIHSKYYVNFDTFNQSGIFDFTIYSDSTNSTNTGVKGGIVYGITGISSGSWRYGIVDESDKEIDWTFRVPRFKELIGSEFTFIASDYSRAHLAVGDNDRDNTWGLYVNGVNKPTGWSNSSAVDVDGSNIVNKYYKLQPGISKLVCIGNRNNGVYYHLKY